MVISKRPGLARRTRALLRRSSRRTHHKATAAHLYDDGRDGRPNRDAGRRADALSADVTNLRTRTVQNTSAVKQLQQAITLSPPPANTAPETIGEHVAQVEHDLGDVRKNLSDNLGVHIHGLVDATYDYNFNQPNFTTGRITEWSRARSHAIAGV